MRIYITSLLLIAGLSLATAQEVAYGIKAGTNFASGGQISGHSHKEEGEYVYWTGTAQGQTKIGFHGGAFLEMDFGDFFLRPELVYTLLQTDFVFPNKTSTFSVHKVDIPILLGYNFNNIGGVYAGPVYSPVYKNELEYKQWTTTSNDETIEGKSLSQPELPVNLQIGVKSRVLGVGVDLRYEHNLSNPQPEKIDLINSEMGRIEGGVNMATVDKANLSQVILSLTYDLSDLIAGSDRRGHSYSRRRRVR